MILIKRVLVPVALFALLVAAGCSSAPDPSDPSGDVTASQAAAQTGCRTVCPKCRPNQPCPAIACYLDCRSNQPGSCQSDADCRLFDDYCTGCNCVALSTNQRDPTCSGPGVRCLVEPCSGHTATCVSGMCTVL